MSYRLVVFLSTDSNYGFEVSVECGEFMSAQPWNSLEIEFGGKPKRYFEIICLTRALQGFQSSNNDRSVHMNPLMDSR